MSDPRDLAQISTADGETFGGTLAVALWVAVEANPGLLDDP